MAGSVNKAIILGNLGTDPEVKYLPSGQAVCELRVATSYDFQDKSGQAQQRTEWHRVAVWGKVAENCGKYLKKGQQVYVEGRIQTRSWEDKEGKKQYMTEVVADQVVFLSKAGTSGGHTPSGEDMGESRSRPASTSGGRSVGSEPTFPEDDDIPF